MMIMIKVKQVVIIKKTMKQVMMIMNNKKQIIMIMIKVIVIVKQIMI